jgi:hypothetical protein
MFSEQTEMILTRALFDANYNEGSIAFTIKRQEEDKEAEK